MPQICETDEQKRKALEEYKEEMGFRNFTRELGITVYTVIGLPLVRLTNMRQNVNNSNHLRKIISNYINYFRNTNQYRETRGIAILPVKNFWEELEKLCRETRYRWGWNISERRGIINSTIEKIREYKEQCYIILYLVARDKKMAWEFPGGKVKPGEKCFFGMQRELKEETGMEINIQKILKIYSTSRNPTVREIWYRISIPCKIN